MEAYKLFRKLKNGEIAPLFINKKQRLQENVDYIEFKRPKSQGGTWLLANKMRILPDE